VEAGAGVTAEADFETNETASAAALSKMIAAKTHLFLIFLSSLFE
jgi:hypothetical protein